MLASSSMDSEEKRIRQKLKDDFLHYARKCLMIRPKEGNLQPFVANKAQLYTHEKLQYQKGQTGKVRAIILKGRQQGMSTLIGGRFYHLVTHNFGMQAFIMAHSMAATDNLYKLAQRYYEHTPNPVKPTVSINNSKELKFSELDSGYKVGTSENKNVGRSATIQLLHCSEVGFWNNADEHAKGIMQSVPDMPGTEIILESTANGIGNYFHQMWQKAEAGESEYTAIFVPWYWQNEYTKEVPEDFKKTSDEIELQEIYGLTDGQIVWRRNKIIEFSVNGMNGEKAFRQEYPFNPAEAFVLTGDDNFIEGEIVMRARKHVAEKFGPLVVGVDVARFGADRTSIIRRRGRCAYGLESYEKKDNMEIVSIIHQIIENEKPAKVCIDLGGGSGIIDRLRELGHEDVVVSVNFGETSLDDKTYLMRSYMWAKMKEWLQEGQVQIPDSNSLHADLCGLKYKFDSNSRLRIESKEEAKKRGVRSPDEADALALTFSLTQKMLMHQNKEQDIAKSLAQNLKTQLHAINKANNYV